MPEPDAKNKWAEDAEEDRALLIETLDGKSDAYGRLFEKYRQRVFGVVYRILHNEEEALDVVQDAFIKAYQSLDGLRGGGSFYPWLRKIACHLAIDNSRSRKRRQAVEFDDALHGDSPDETFRGVKPAAAQPSESLEAAELNAVILKALDSLSPSHRAVFVLHAVEDMSYKDISESLDCPLGTVMSRLYYARRELRSQLEATGINL